MNKKERYQLTRERNESDMICEKIIDTKPTDKEIIEKIVKWLELNIKAPYLETDFNLERYSSMRQTELNIQTKLANKQGG